MDYDFITTCNWTSTGTFTLEAYRGTQSNVVTSFTLYYRKKGSPTWSSTNNGQINITSTGEWEVANDWNKSGNDVLTHSYFNITAINSCTNVYFNEETLGNTVGHYFMHYCWYLCSNLVSMPEGFNLPSGITTVGNHFLKNSWSYCSSLTSMPEGFNIPQGITGSVIGFFNSCWVGCTSLESIPSGFSIPGGITSALLGVLPYCWEDCTKLKQDGYTEDLVFEFNSNGVFSGTCPIIPDSITGASKANPVRVAVNRPQPPDVTVDVEPDETVLSSSAVSVTEGTGVSPSANVDTIVFTNPNVSVITTENIIVDLNTNEIVFTNPNVSVITTENIIVDLNTNEIVFTNPSVGVAVQANTIIDVSANETNLNSLGVNITEGEGISFDTSTDQAIFTNLAIKAVEQGGGYSPLASILNFISPEITVETEFNWKDDKKTSLAWTSKENKITNWKDRRANKTIWS